MKCTELSFLFLLAISATASALSMSSNKSDSQAPVPIFSAVSERTAVNNDNTANQINRLFPVLYTLYTTNLKPSEINSVLDSSNPVIRATISTTQGVNFLPIVPEPATFLFLVAGMILFIHRTRNEKDKQISISIPLPVPPRLIGTRCAGEYSVG